MQRLYNDFWLAVGFFTRLPTPTLHGAIDMARALALAPLVGAGIGLAAGAIFVLSLDAGLPAFAAALIAIAATVALTGALHEDGLADCADGFGGGRDAAAKLAIMKDSRIGSYGTLALIFAIGLRCAALVALPDPLSALAAAHAAARGGFAAALRYMPSARPGGLADVVGRPEAASAAVALSFATAFALWFVGPIPLLAGAAAGGLVLWLARRQIGGVTGDVLGASAVLTEIAMLLACCAVR
jgi:adenosylcobinamide-GDP ribazoletransferase